MNGQFATIFALLVLLPTCAGHTSPGIIDLPPNPYRGAPRALLNVRQPLIRGRHHRIEFALLGSPRYENLRNPVAYQFSILADGTVYREIIRANPQISRFHVWFISADFSRKIRGTHITVYVEVYRLAGYTYSGIPILTKPFTRDSVKLRVSHPVAGGQFERHLETSYFVL